MLLNYGVEEDSWDSLELQRYQTSSSQSKSVLNIHWNDWCWSWNSSTLSTWCEELAHWKRPWCWERLRAGGEEDDRGWDGWMASLTQWTWVWVNSGSWWQTGKTGCCSPLGHNKLDTTEQLNWTELNGLVVFPTFFNLSLNFAIRSSWSEPVSSWSCLCWLYRASLSFMCWHSNPTKTLLGTWTHVAGTTTQLKPMVSGFRT